MIQISSLELQRLSSPFGCSPFKKKRIDCSFLNGIQTFTHPIQITSERIDTRISVTDGHSEEKSVVASFLLKKGDSLFQNRNEPFKIEKDAFSSYTIWRLYEK